MDVETDSLKYKNHENVQFFHWNLPNAVISAAGPFGANWRVINHVLKAGVAAAVTKTITPFPQNINFGIKHFDKQTFNREGYSYRPISSWKNDFTRLKGKKIIANIFAENSQELTKLAIEVVSQGIEVIELGLSCPTLGKDPICCSPKLLYTFTSSVRREINIPIIVKVLVQMPASLNREIFHAVESSGADAICISDSLPALVTKPDSHEFILGGTGGLSGPFMKPLVMKALDDNKDSNILKIACGGVTSIKDVRDYISVGASVIQVCSHFLRTGWNGVRLFVKEISKNSI